MAARGPEPLKRVLSEFTRIEGVTGAIVVSKDGYVIDALVPTGEINAEAVGAMIVGVFNNSNDFGKELGLGDVALITAEYANGLVIAEDLGNAYLVVVAEKGAVLGRIRYEVQKQKERLKTLI